MPNEGLFTLEVKIGLIPWNFRHQVHNKVTPHLSRTENTSDNMFNELFIDCDSYLYNIDDNSNVNGNLLVEEGAVLK